MYIYIYIYIHICIYDVCVYVFYVLYLLHLLPIFNQTKMSQTSDISCYLSLIWCNNVSQFLLLTETLFRL